MKNTIFSYGSPITFEELHHYLLTHEFVNPDLLSVGSSSTKGILPTPPPSVNYVARDQGYAPSGRGRSFLGRYSRGSAHSNHSDRHNLASPLSPSSYAPWVPDTGASHHITLDLASLQHPEIYPRHDRLQVANGQQLQISHTGSGNVSTSTFWNE
ncbi:hypothetical protein LIER_38008 [Lithospermum erythrorhizon]|uniref:Uncharacterized protein n=1 Tax=Lithospermum erythrorhizon TaxID=34254 RepID=A0AAV3PWH4_LITER